MAHDGTVEKDINLNIALNLEKILKFYGYSVVMTRTEDTATYNIDDNASVALRKISDLKNRLALMNKFNNSIYVSVHLNKFTTTSAMGAQVFYGQKVEESRYLAENIQNAIVSLIQPENKRVVKRGTNNAFLLKNATVPAVIVECGFLSNKTELNLLKNKEYQSKISFAIATGIEDFFKE